MSNYCFNDLLRLPLNNAFIYANCKYYTNLTPPVSCVEQGAYYTPPVYAAQPHVIHHTTVVQPNSIPSTALYPAPVPVPAPRNNGMAAMGMVAGTTMAMSAGGSGAVHSNIYYTHFRWYLIYWLLLTLVAQNKHKKLVLCFCFFFF